MEYRIGTIHRHLAGWQFASDCSSMSVTDLEYMMAKNLIQTQVIAPRDHGKDEIRRQREFWEEGDDPYIIKQMEKRLDKDSLI